MRFAAVAPLAVCALAGCGFVVPLAGILGGGGGQGGNTGRAVVVTQGSVHVETVAIAGRCVVSPLCSTTYCFAELPENGAAQLACDAPLLVEWPDHWTLEELKWQAPALQASGTIVVEPATSYLVPASLGAIVTDPGYSAYVLHLDVANVGPATFELHARFDVGTDMAACLKGIRVATIAVADGPRLLAPDPPMSLDFTALQAPDPHVVCISATIGVAPGTWGRVKALYE